MTDTLADFAERARKAQQAVNELGAGVPSEEPGWTQVAVHAVLLNYDLIVKRAQYVAEIVYRVRYPRDSMAYFEIEFYDDPPYRGFEAHYHYRSNNHSIHIPIDYLWETDDDTIRQRETERIDAERAAAELRRKTQEAAEKAEQEDIERKTYERLRKKFEKGS